MLLILLSACSTASNSDTRDDGVEVTSPEGALFQVVPSNGAPVNFTVEQVKAMPQVAIEVDGKTEAGPALLTVLEEARVSEFSSVTLQGLNFNITLEKSEVTDEVILDVTNRGTVKFASPTVPKENWPKDITLITIK
ncbi:MAG: hypothetical protein JXB38_21900 [Anaerolineales bacterium]|nr:hypothetical protein [Anaerolineales bacterium]